MFFAFEGTETTILYVLRFEAFEQNLSTPKKCLTVRKIQFDEENLTTSAAIQSKRGDRKVSISLASKLGVDSPDMTGD